MAQKLDELTMFKEEGIITTIPCFRLHRVPFKECDIFEFNLCQHVMKSESKLPEGLFGKNGSGIISVTNVDEMVEYKYITPNDFRRLKNRKYARDTTRYYTIKDGYIYLPDSTNELLELRMITLDKKEAEKVSSCIECDCRSIWEHDFVCPDRFLDLVAKDTLNELATIFRTTPEDENPNLNVNEKTGTVN
jgi:hypothetical protein